MTFDPLMDERVAPGVTVARDDKDNPLVVPRGGVGEVSYTRASSLASYLTYFPKSLADWRGRYEAQGIARYRDLAARIAAVHYSTGPLTGTLPIEARRRAAAEIDAVRAEAAERMGISEAANLGTAGHSLTEPGSAGDPLEELQPVVDGYNEVTAGLERVGSEIFVVNDTLRAAGTFDSMYYDEVNFPGCFLVGDTKTGKNYHQAEFEIQIATYQGGELYLGAPKVSYDHVTEYVEHQRLTFEEAFGRPVNADVGYLVHVSVTGSPKPRIVKLDLARGRRLAQLAADVRDARQEIDGVGIGEKLDHKAQATAALALQFERLWEGDAWDLSVEEAVERARELAKRFKHVWPQEYTDRVKARVS